MSRYQQLGAALAAARRHNALEHAQVAQLAGDLVRAVCLDFGIADPTGHIHAGNLEGLDDPYLIHSPLPKSPSYRMKLTLMIHDDPPVVGITPKITPFGLTFLPRGGAEFDVKILDDAPPIRVTLDDLTSYKLFASAIYDSLMRRLTIDRAAPPSGPVPDVN
ncbi:MAG: hypothetical protein H6Q90_4879 [Deltaproteobacteria bacterium]|nr:hypothetical protein [Deltaproteobacteria bacterium]